MVVEAIIGGFLAALGWWGANYYVITPYLPEPIYAEKRIEEEKKKAEKQEVNTILKEKSNDKID